jgi:protein tyrosine phosphatase
MLIDKQQIKKEFAQLSLKLKSQSPSFKTAQLNENKKKNRYPNVLPLESTRVQLYCNNCFCTKSNQTRACSCQEDNYVNGNFVSTPMSESVGRFFIAAECPMPSTYEAFWRMVWQNNVRMIFMLSDFEEDGVVKGHPYFPVNANVEGVYGSFKVKLNSVLEQNVMIREFTIKNIQQNETRKIYHVHYRCWPDHGVPGCVDEVLTMIQIAENFFNHFGSPIVVHCSAGIGRTGTFISIFNCINSLRMCGRCNIVNTVEKLRSERFGSVTRESQYEFIYQVVMYYMTICNNIKNVKESS